MKKIDSGLSIIIISLLVVVGVFAVSHLTSILPASSLWTSLLIIAFFVMSSVFIGLTYLKPSLELFSKKQNEEVLNAVDAAIESMQLKFSGFENRMDVFQVFQDPDWVITTNELVSRETTLPKEEVWIVSSYLGAELDDGLFGPVIEANTKRGIRYNYVIPDDHQARAKIAAIKNMVSTPENVKAIQVDERDLFVLLSTHDTCVFDPFVGAGGITTGYMNVPNEINDLDYFVKLGGDYCYRLVSTVKAIGKEIEV